MLDFPEHKLRVIAPDVGGGFGVKGPVYREDVVAATLSRQLCRPIRWMSTRNEDLLTTLQARAAVSDAEAAFTADGQLIGLRIETIFDLGAHLISLSLVPPLSYSIHVLGPYRVANAELLNVGVYTNTAPTGPYRGSGRPVGVYVIERVLDEAARVTGLDPIAIRRRNFVPADAFPYRTAFGVAYDSGNYARALDRVEARKRGDLMGIGVAAYVESTNVLGWESGVVRVERSGKVHRDHRIEPARPRACDDVRADRRGSARHRLRGTDRAPWRHAGRAAGDRDVRQPQRRPRRERARAGRHGRQREGTSTGRTTPGGEPRRRRAGPWRFPGSRRTGAAAQRFHPINGIRESGESVSPALQRAGENRITA
jgi:hypothetical protein